MPSTFTCRQARQIAGKPAFLSARIGTVGARFEGRRHGEGDQLGQLTHKAFRGLMAEVLALVAREGLPPATTTSSSPSTPPTRASTWRASLRARYPKEMTIVLQESFADLAVMKDRFSVTLNFGNVPEPIVVPFDRGGAAWCRPERRVRPALRRARGGRGRRRRGREQPGRGPHAQGGRETRSSASTRSESTDARPAPALTRPWQAALKRHALNLTRSRPP